MAKSISKFELQQLFNKQMKAWATRGVVHRFDNDGVDEYMNYWAVRSDVSLRRESAEHQARWREEVFQYAASLSASLEMTLLAVEVSDDRFRIKLDRGDTSIPSLRRR